MKGISDDTSVAGIFIILTIISIILLSFYFKNLKTDKIN
jgi:uncharacterized membrane protein